MTVEIVGAQQYAADLGQLSDKLRELPALADLGRDMADAALSVVRRRSGRLAGTIRAATERNLTTLHAGGGLPYARVQDAGWPAHHITPNNFTRAARDLARREAPDQVRDSIRGLIRRQGL